MQRPCAPPASLGARAAGGEPRVDLFLMRHGKAGARAPSTADSSRALTSAGAREVKKAASGLRRAGISFDYVASSPLTRAMQTARIVAGAAAAKPAGGRGTDAAAAGRKKGRPAPPPSVHRWDELKPEAAAESALERIAGLAYDSSALLVGHEPCMTMLLGLLVSGGGAGRRGPASTPAPPPPAPSINLKKGGMARLRIVSTVPEVRGELRWLATPRHLECLQ